VVQWLTEVAMCARAPGLRAEKRTGATGRWQGKVSQAEALCSRARAWRQHVAAKRQAPFAHGWHELKLRMRVKFLNVD
jgi:hypothetical protein